MTNTTNNTTTPKTATPKTAEATADAELKSATTTASRQEAATEAKLGTEASATADKAKAEASKTYDAAATEAARLKDKAAGLGEQAKSAAYTAADEARSYARSFADEQKANAADGVRDVSRALGDAADNLDERYGFVAGYVRDAAGEVDRVASTLKDRSIDDLVYSVEGFARRQPTAFLGATVLAGFALARFIKSSAREDDYAPAGYRGQPNYGVPAERGSYDDPYLDAGIPHRAVNPPNRMPVGSKPGDLSSGTSASVAPATGTSTTGTSGSATAPAGTPAASGGSTYTSGTSASSPVSGSGATKSA